MGSIVMHLYKRQRKLLIFTNYLICLDYQNFDGFYLNHFLKIEIMEHVEPMIMGSLRMQFVNFDDTT